MAKTLLLSELAPLVKRTPERLRQICQQHGIGILLTSRLRVLTAADAVMVRKIIAKSGKTSGPKTWRK